MLPLLSGNIGRFRASRDDPGGGKAIFDMQTLNNRYALETSIGEGGFARVYLANVYEQTGKPEKALAQLEAYLKENPKATQAEAVRGAIEKLRKKTKKP